MQRLYSTFPDGWPACGLLLMRGAQCVPLLSMPGSLSWPASRWELTLKGVQVTATLLLGLGLLTPAAGVVAAAIYASCLVPHFDPNVLPYAAMPLALAMLGPGAWSVDARLYGRRRITF